MGRPAKRAHPRTNHNVMARQLRAQPGVWQRVSVHRSRATAHGAAQRIRTAYRYRWYEPAGSFDAEAVVFGDDYAVLARYIGPTTNTRKDGCS